MIAKLRDVKLPSIGESRMHWLHSAGVHTAYDVQRKGANGLNEIYSIGPTLALSLVEWAKTYIPANLPVDTSSRDYIQRLRVLKRK